MLPLLEEVTQAWLIEHITSASPIAASRWGDGEWRAVLQAANGKMPRGQSRFQNCDKHRFFPAMNSRLFRILQSDPPYLLGFQKFSWGLYSKQIEKFSNRYLPSRRWFQASIFSRAALRGEFGKFLAAIRDRPNLFVGPNYLRGLDRYVRIDKFVEVPRQNCFLELQRIVDEAAEAASQLPPGSLVSISASMPANIIVDRLFHRLDNRYIVLDMGSVYDPFVGVQTRTQHTKWQLKQNLSWLS